MSQVLHAQIASRRSDTPKVPQRCLPSALTKLSWAKHLSWDRSTLKYLSFRPMLITGVSKNAIQRLTREIGEACLQFQDKTSGQTQGRRPTPFTKVLAMGRARIAAFRSPSDVLLAHRGGREKSRVVACLPDAASGLTGVSFGHGWLIGTTACRAARL
jgi:hypothetical protein